MTTRAAIGAITVLVIAGCGSDSSRSSAPTAVAPATSSATTAPQVEDPSDDRLGLDAVTDEVTALPVGEMADGGCGWTEESYMVARAPSVFSGRPARLGAPGMTSDALGRVVEFDVVEVFVDESGRLEPGEAVDVFVADTLIIAGALVAVPSLDVEQVVTHDVVTVFGVPDDSGFVRPVRAFSQTDDGPSMNGYCDHELEVFEDVAERLGAPDALSMLVEFAEADARGEGIAALSGAFEQWRADIDAASAPVPWADQDPTTRQLGPQTVPPDLLSALDVVGVSYALDDLGDADAVGVRTESGVSGSLVGANVLPSVGPVYFLGDVDATVEVFVHAAGQDAEPQVVASVPLAAVVEAGGGIEVTGSVRDGTVAIATLTRDQIADRLDVEPGELDQLRASLLTP